MKKKKNSFVIIRFKILLWHSGYENISEPSRNRPQGRERKTYIPSCGKSGMSTSSISYENTNRTCYYQF